MKSLFTVACAAAVLAAAVHPGDTIGATNDATTWSVAQNLDAVALSGSCGLYDQTWQHIFPESLGNEPDGWQSCTMNWCREAHYSALSYDADKYTTSGYDSSGHILTYYDYTGTYDEPVFYQIGYGNGQ